MMSEEKTPVEIKGSSNGWTFVSTVLLLLVLYSCEGERGTLIGSATCYLDPEYCSELGENNPTLAGLDEVIDRNE